jgi:hypothetical protein
MLLAVNGNVYIGHWVDDIKEGLGVFYYKEKGSKYEGVWKRDVPVGGTYTREIIWDPFKDMDDVLQLPPLEVANFQKLARDSITSAWKQPMSVPFQHFTSAMLEPPQVPIFSYFLPEEENSVLLSPPPSIQAATYDFCFEHSAFIHRKEQNMHTSSALGGNRTSLLGPILESSP